MDKVEMIQNRVPKLVTDTLEPVEYPANPELEWCPPGHGDIYPALVGSGWLDKLLAAGGKYAFVSNSDNLGAQLDTRFLRWFAESGAPFVMEVTRRTEADKKGGGVLLITEGVFGMTGALGILDQIVALKEKHSFRIMIDDAHGFGVMGPHGRGTSEHFNVMDGVDIYIGAYAKSMAIIGGFIASDKDIIDYLKYNMRSQIYAKSLPMPIVEGCLKRLEIIDSAEGDELRAKLWEVTRTLQKGFRDLGFDIGPAEACVTPVLVKAGVNSAANIAVALREEYHIFCSVVIYPVIPPGMVIFRVIPTAAHSMADVERTLAAFKDMKERLDRGEFDKEMPNMALLK